MTEEEKRNIFLCGFMATGKSSVGKRLAAALHWEFLDMDALIESEAETSISEIFSSRGEAAFRVMEARMVERLAERTGCVVATGGGVIVEQENLKKMKRCGVVITVAPDEGQAGADPHADGTAGTLLRAGRYRLGHFVAHHR